MKRARLLFLLGILLLVAVLPAAAITDIQAIDYVSTAFENMLKLESYTMVMEQHLIQDINAGPTQVKQDLTQNITGAIIYYEDGTAGVDLSMNQVLEMIVPNQPVTTIEMTMGMRLVDSNLYILVSNVKPAAAAAVFPTTWVNLTEDTTAIPGLEYMDADQLAAMMSSQVGYPVNEDTVLEISELEPEILKGMNTRVFAFTLDLLAIFSSPEFDMMTSGFNFSQFGLDLQDIIDAVGEGGVVSYKVWINDANQLPVRLETEVVMSMHFDQFSGIRNVTLDQTVTAAGEFGNFNEPVTIEAPED